MPKADSPNELAASPVDASLAQRLAWRGEAALVAGFWALAERLGPDRASAFGSRLVAAIGPRSRKAKMVRANLRVVRPEASEAELARLVRASFAHFGRVLGEFPHLGVLCEPPRAVVVDPLGLLDAARGRPSMFVSGHFANWEISAGVAARAGVPITVVHATRANPLVTELLLRRRSALGCRFLDRDASPAAMLREIRAGRSIGVLVDQRHDAGDLVPFFGRPAPAPLAPALLAARLDLPFVPVRVERLDGAAFRVTLCPPIAPDPSLGEPRAIARDMMERLYRLFETWIDERPEQWLCIKRRWPDLRKAKWRDKAARNPRLAHSGTSEPVDRS